EQMTDQQLRDEAVTLFLAGYETTSVAMAWSFHYLTQQAEFAARLHAETDAVLGDRDPVFMDVPQLAYARMVMQEALRLYSPTYWVSRTAEEDDVIDGYRIRKGQMVAIMSHMIHRHPDFWQHPEAFDPERFTPENSAGRHQLAWIPFGAGQRQCIGRDFALMEGQLILTKIAQRYNVHAIPGKVAAPHVSTTLRTKDGVWVTISKRDK
ncbi:MAG TPA: cytochrome P450, partial [Phototrophicaceae bacterium]|nr:cytochrome P450 [Phototrophicaceae bacterium]